GRGERDGGAEALRPRRDAAEDRIRGLPEGVAFRRRFPGRV
ncbi:MAG: hypothetical protein AVDCRST_MAG01-01-3921, partial [uncultured Rubrobacteraceae bacterium]